MFSYIKTKISFLKELLFLIFFVLIFYQIILFYFLTFTIMLKSSKDQILKE